MAREVARVEARAVMETAAAAMGEAARAVAKEVVMVAAAVARAARNHGQKRERQLTSITVASQKEALEASTYVHQLSCKCWYICDGLWQS